MVRNSRGKRPCCICRKWFQPDVRQKGRQKTCGPDCRNELHRRQCKNWNKKNKAYFKNNYLAKKIEKADEQTASSHKEVFSKHREKPVLPIEVIATEYGIKPAIIVQYLAGQIASQTNGSSARVT
jgi:hypothetical protein